MSTVAHSKSLTLIKDLKVAIEYSTLLNQIKLMNQLGQYSKVIPKDKLNEYINENSILYINEDKELKDDSIKIYMEWPNHDQSFGVALGFILKDYPDLVSELNLNLNDDINKITESAYDEIYDYLCDKINSISDEYKQIAENFERITTPNHE